MDLSLKRPTRATWMKGLALGIGAAAFVFAACPIAPNFAIDSGVIDSGVEGDAGVDAGVDAGAYGTLGASLSTSDGNPSSLAWNGTDLSASTVDSTGQVVTIRATNTTSGSFLLQLVNLTAGSTDGLWAETTYSPPSGVDTWVCTNIVGNSCSVLVDLTNFDGINIAGTFSISFSPDAAENSAILTSGSFTVTLQ